MMLFKTYKRRFLMTGDFIQKFYMRKQPNQNKNEVVSRRSANVATLPVH